MTKRSVLFLGAGASVPFGYPVTDRILPRIWEELASGAWRQWAGIPKDPNAAQEEADALREFLCWILPGLVDQPTQVRGASIVEVISLLDQMLVDGRSIHPRIDEEGLRRIRLLLSKGINGVLQGASGRSTREALARWILDEAAAGGRVTLASTNYDTVIEQPLYSLIKAQNRRVEDVVDFGIAWRDPGRDVVHLRPRDATLSVLKLHGSLNWLRCETCGFVYINQEGRIASQGLSAIQTDYNTCDCGGRLRMVIVTPSVVRDVRDANLLTIWNVMLEELRRADEWILVGYSLPSEDIAIRSLFLRALHTRVTPKLAVRVIQYEDPSRPQPPEGSAEFLRYRMFFPRELLPDDQYRRDGVEAFIASLRA